MPGYSASSALRSASRRSRRWRSPDIASSSLLRATASRHGRAQRLRCRTACEEAEDLALVDAVDRGLERALAGQQDPHGLGTHAARVAGELRAGHLGHVVVGHQHCDLFCRDPAERFARRQRGANVELFAFEAARRPPRAMPRRRRRTRSEASAVIVDNQRRQPRRSVTRSISSSAASIARIPGKRACGVFCRQVVTTSTSFAGSGPCGLSTGGIGALRCIMHSLRRSSSLIRRVARRCSSNSTAPRPYWSERSVGARPRSCSGEMYAGVPRTNSAFSSRMTSPASSASPKSTSFTVRSVALADDEHVRRRDVGVDDAAIVRGGERVGELARDRDDLRRRQRAAMVDEVRQALALEQLHHEVRPAVGEVAEVEHVDDVGVSNARGRARLAQEVLRRGGLALDDLVAQDLERVVAAEQRCARPRTRCPCRLRRGARSRGTDRSHRRGTVRSVHRRPRAVAGETSPSDRRAGRSRDGR